LAFSENQKNNVMQILTNAISSGERMLGELLGKQVTISISQIDSIDSSGLNNFFPGRNLVAQSGLGDAGNAVLMVSENQAALMADLMIGQDGSNPPAQLEDLHLSAVTELMNQTTDSIISVIASQVAQTITSNPMEVTVVDMDASVIPGIDGEVIIADADLKIGDFQPGKFGLIFKGNIVEILKSGPKAEASAEGFVSDITAGQQMKAAGPTTAQKVITSEVREEKKMTVYDQSLDLILDVPLQVTVELGRTNKLVKDVLELSPGSVIELDKLAGEPVDILVNQKYIAKGEVVVIDENFGIRITDIIKPADRIPKI
jgi:flagellar motor switch protein FliN/FliY